VSTSVLAAEEPINPLLPATPDLIWGSLVFVVLFILFWRYVLPTYLKTLDERTAAIQGGIEKAEKAQAEAAELRQQYEAQVAAAREEAGRTREQARTEGAAIIAAMRTEAQAEAARIVESGHRQIEAERQQAMTQLRREVGRISVGLAERIVGETLTDDTRQQRVVDRFLADLESADGEPVSAGSAGAGTTT
jgi:F-type H+-transporting ATPase subunit b